MSKKKKSAKSRKKAVRNQATHKQSPEQFHLSSLIKLTDRARDHDDSELDLYFENQSNRLRDLLEALKVKR